MESEKTLKELIEAIQKELGIFRGEMKADVGDLKSDVSQLKFDIRRLGAKLEMMDDKFTLLSEGQEIIHDILETRVAHIEESLEIGTVA